MSDPKKQPQPKTAGRDPVDLAEQLRASINADRTSDPPAPTIPAEDDDLRALLLDQLSKSTPKPAPGKSSPQPTPAETPAKPATKAAPAGKSSPQPTTDTPAKPATKAAPAGKSSPQPATETPAKPATKAAPAGKSLPQPTTETPAKPATKAAPAGKSLPQPTPAETPAKPATKATPAGKSLPQPTPAETPAKPATKATAEKSSSQSTAAEAEAPAEKSSPQPTTPAEAEKKGTDLGTKAELNTNVSYDSIVAVTEADGYDVAEWTAKSVPFVPDADLPTGGSNRMASDLPFVDGNIMPDSDVDAVEVENRRTRPADADRPIPTAVPAPAPILPAADALLTDGRINSIDDDGRVADSRISRLDRENARLLIKPTSDPGMTVDPRMTVDPNARAAASGTNGKNTVGEAGRPIGEAVSSAGSPTGTMPQGFSPDASQPTPVDPYEWDDIDMPKDDAAATDDPRSSASLHRIGSAIGSLAHDPLQIGADRRTEAGLPHGTPRNDTALRKRERHTPLTFAFHAKQDASPSSKSSDPSEVDTAPLPDASAYARSLTPSDRESTDMRDTELYLSLGLGACLSDARAQSLVDAVRREDDAPRPASDPEAHGGRTEDMTKPLQLRRRFRRQRSACGMRFALSLVAAWLAVIYDNLPVILADIGAPKTFVTGPYHAIFGCLWMLLVSLPFITRLGKGCGSVLRFAPERYAVAGCALPLCAAYTLLSAYVAYRGQAPLPLYTGAALSVLAVEALAEFLAVDGDVSAFDVVSSGKDTYLLTTDRTHAAYALGEDPGLPVDDLLRGKRSQTDSLTLVRTPRAGRFMQRIRTRNPYMNALNLLLAAALPISLLAAALCVLRGGDILADGARVFLSVYLFCLPAGYLVGLCYPLCHANRMLAKRGCTVIGAATPADFAAEGTRILLSDRDVIRADHRKIITIREEEMEDRTRDWRRLCNRLFHLIGSPLVEEHPLEDDVTPITNGEMHAELIERDTHYRRFSLVDHTSGRDETFDVMIGTYDALAARGVRLIKREKERDYRRSPDAEVLYVAFNGHLCLIYAASYRPSKSFARLYRAITEAGCIPVLAAHDPLVTAELLGTARFAEYPALQVVFPRAVDAVKRDRASGIAATGRRTDVTYLLSATHRMRQCYGLSLALTRIFSVATAALSIALAVLAPTAGISPTLAAVIHFITTAPALILTMAMVNRRTIGYAHKDPPTRKRTRRDPPAQTDRSSTDPGDPPASA